MFYFILAFFIGLRFLGILFKRYRTPYILNLYYGKKGAGKSSIFIRDLLRYQAKGYQCYTDIPCNIPGVHIVNSLDLATFTLEQNSFIAMDEGGLLFDNRSFKTFPKGLTEWFKLQRHFRCICSINSQSPDIDLKIKNLADNLYIVRKVTPFFAWIRPIGRQVKLVGSTAEADSRIVEDLYYKWIFSWRFVFLPKYWSYFDSFAVPDRPIIKSSVIPCYWIQDFQIGSTPGRYPPPLRKQLELEDKKAALGTAPPL